MLAELIEGLVFELDHRHVLLQAGAVVPAQGGEQALQVVEGSSGQRHFRTNVRIDGRQVGLVAGHEFLRPAEDADRAWIEADLHVIGEAILEIGPVVREVDGAGRIGGAVPAQAQSHLLHAQVLDGKLEAGHGLLAVVTLEKLLRGVGSADRQPVEPVFVSREELRVGARGLDPGLVLLQEVFAEPDAFDGADAGSGGRKGERASQEVTPGNPDRHVSHCLLRMAYLSGRTRD